MVWFPLSNKLFGIDGLNDKNPPAKVAHAESLYQPHADNENNALKH